MHDSINFQKSITQELEIIKNRVRNLIGNANWPEDGRYKEAILSQSISAQLPQHISIGTGFIVKKDEQHENITLSKQHDLILYDNRSPLVMKYGQFVIAAPYNVLGVIEVKSNLTPKKFQKAFEKLEDSLEKVLDDYESKFIGIFSFDFRNNDKSINYHIENNEAIKQTLKESKKIVNHICLGENYFIKFWKREDGRRLSPPTDATSDFFNCYYLSSLSYSYFISNILHKICDNIDERYWHSFPIVGTKERYKVETIEINLYS